MKRMKMDDAVRARVSEALKHTPHFERLAPDALGQVAGLAELVRYDAGEAIVEQGSPSEHFFVILQGDADVTVTHAIAGGEVPIRKMEAGDSFGEMGLLQGTPRTATVRATNANLIARFGQPAFEKLIGRIPHFGMAVCRSLADRLATLSRSVPLPAWPEDEALPPLDTLTMLPGSFAQRHRVLPLASEGDTLVVGFVDEPTHEAMDRVRANLSGGAVRAVSITSAFYDRVMQSQSAAEGWSGFHRAVDMDADEPGAIPRVAASPARRRQGTSPRLDELLHRMVAEGASDLHLCAGQRPRWRVDGGLKTLVDAPILGPEEVYTLHEPILREAVRERFLERNDCDFAYSLPDVARFRGNLYRDHHGVCAAHRKIPNKILTLDQLGMPEVCLQLCDLPKGLVLVTGATGSGKSTTLAAMIDYINKNRPCHILTLEDPVEFVHESRQALVNQRQVGDHTESFADALKASLREDPDVILVGEMRDPETIALALELANTGHLVYGTLHTSDAISTVDRVINVFPSEEQAQIRMTLSTALRGVLSQTLCKRTGGGRVAAVETMVVDGGMANLMREGKTHQLASAMSTGAARGNKMLNVALAELVRDGKVDKDEALSKALDKNDFERRLGAISQGR